SSARAANARVSHFFALSDRYVVDLPVYGTNIYSLGDFVLFAGLGLVVIQVAGELVTGRGRSAAATEVAGTGR
ncbi:MAG TPA: hypothetical protein PKK39_09730, partial [Tepidiformaceae bacterium]|nr:hypothetical protein [Tepidiformaceae bacterium]